MASVIQDSKPVENREKLGPDQRVGRIDRIPADLLTRVRELDAGKKMVELWYKGNTDRTEWLERQTKYLATWDEFIDNEDVARGPWANSSNLHLPITLTACRAMHARMYAALMSIDPPFNVKPMDEASTVAVPLVEGVMAYTLREWINYRQGAAEMVDMWLWNWITQGSGIGKLRWDRTYSRYVEVYEEPVKYQGIDPATGDLKPITKMVEKERPVTKKTFDGPVADIIDPEDLCIVGGKGDPDRADSVIHRYYLTRSELYALADTGVFDADTVQEILNSGFNGEYVDTASALKQEKVQNSGIIQYNTNADLERFEILECYCKMDENGDGLDENLILWVHTKSKKELRVTYLDRVMEGGETPFYKIDFLKKRDHIFGMGIPEILYSLQKEIDAMHNIRIDFGVLSTMPFGFYRPQSGLNPARMDLEPGKLIPVNDPQGDVFFPQLGNRTFFSDSEESSLMAYIERIISISDLNLGRIGGQGAARTATGVSAVMGENNSNLDIYIKRMQRGWKKFLRLLFQNLQRRMPKEMWIRITGDDGKLYPFRIQREDIRFNYDFDIDANSSDSNKSVRRDIAQQRLNLCLNPLLIQTRVVTPDNIYEACKDWLVALEVKDFARFITKPTDFDAFMTPEQEAMRIMKGIPVPIHPAMNHEGFVNYVKMIFSNDQFLGTLSQKQAQDLAQQASQHMKMEQAMDAQAAQQRNIQQQQTNAANVGAQVISAGPSSPISASGG
jgi:hypothetical protein